MDTTRGRSYVKDRLSQAFWWGVFHGSGMSRHRLATTDLYFVNACGHMIRGLPRTKSIRALGANSFAAGSTAVVLRRDYQSSVRSILSGHWDRLIYVVDDDVEAGLDDPNLPLRYRQHLHRLYHTEFRPLLHAADTVVTGSDQLAAKHAATKVSHRIDPHWERDLASAAHFDELERGGILKIVYLGSISHELDLAWILPALERVLANHREVEFSAFLPSQRLVTMAEFANVKIKELRPWGRYKQWVGSESFHVAIYPMRETAFNSARSLNKLIEHAVVGAVGIYSAKWQHAEHVAHGVNGFLAENSLEGWEHALNQAIEKRAELKQIFERSRAVVTELNDRQRQEAFWRHLLQL